MPTRGYKSRPIRSPGRVKFYADENIDPALVEYLRRRHRVNIKTARELGFLGRDDQFHFAEAKRQRRFLLTCDRDYLDHRQFPFSRMIGVVILDVPRKAPGLGWMSLWLESEIVPSGREIEGTKIVLHHDRLEIHFVDDTGSVKRQTVHLIDRKRKD